MADYRGKVPKLDWGSAKGNTLIFPHPPDRARDYSRPDDGSERERIPSGAMDAWITGTLYVVEFDVRHIPLTDTNAFGYTATGWQGTTGWRAFLEFAWDAGEFDLYPDKDDTVKEACKLLAPERGQYDLESSTGLKRLTFRAYSVGGNAFDWY